MKRKVYTDFRGSKEILVEGLGEYTPKEECNRLTEENKKLREALEKALPVVNRAAAMDDSDAKLVIRGVQKLLSELGGEL
ncbi:hypothetical protein [Vibrio cholerae]|uniref:hypothetical protein n=1 Tax=Vibrio cholerae TaxID=666 RepID=UPI0000EF9A8A|nr:hypothetical protein [Vibrio cholerae]KNH57984.1 hypothetical protein A55_1937 [Vibrio cholerae 1587]WOQ95746.1 hypothetical protein R4538_07895 [Vibrio cholerae]